MTETAEKVRSNKQYDSEQIDLFCSALKSHIDNTDTNVDSVRTSLQIIRQLQGEVQRRMAADDRDRRLYD